MPDQTKTKTVPSNSNSPLNALAEKTSFPITRPFEALIERLGPESVFGKPVRNGDTTVIPVAEMRTGFGFGGGRGREAGESGSGGGGGAGVRVTPRGYITIANGVVRFRSIPRFGTFALAGLALAAGLLPAVLPMLRRK